MSSPLNRIPRPGNRDAGHYGCPFSFGGGVDFKDQLGESSAPTCNGEAFMRTPDSYDMI